MVAFVAGLVFLHPAPGEFAGLDLFQRRLHAFLDAGVNNPRSDRHIAPLRRFGNREAHAADARFIHQVHNQLQFVQTFEVSHLRLVTGLDQRFVASQNQRAGPAAQDGLLAEQVGLGLFFERGFYHAGARGADALRPGQRHVLRLPARILVNRDERRHAFAFEILAADNVAGPLRSNQNHIHVFRRDHRFEMNGETVRKQQRFAGVQVRRHVPLVSRRLFRVRQRHENHIAPTHRCGGADHFKSLFLRDRNGFAAFIKADDDVHPAVFEVQRMGVALRTKAEHGQSLVLQDGQVGFFVRVNFCRHDCICGF